jgi:GMP synthase-like glutamine amidotransferase
MTRPRETKAILVLQHADCEPPGAYEEELIARGVPLHRVVLDQGDELPDWRPYAGMIVMGGPMGAYEDSLHPWLGPEKRLIAEAVAGDLPYWGVCLGAQLLAAALGATVAPGPEAEIGVLNVELTESAELDPVFASAPQTFEALQWHGDTFQLPPGTIQLARSPLYEQQAFVIGRAYGLQFHLEVTTTLAGEWMEVPAYVAELEELAGPGAPSRLLEQVRATTPTSVPLARLLFSRWLERVVGLPRPAAD